MKAQRGTKRVCHACAVRFYDLARQPIICPSCGAQYVPDAPPKAGEAGARASRFTDKTTWRGRNFRHPDPEPEPDGAPEVASTDAADEEGLSPAPNDDVVLEEEAEDADISGLLGHHETDPSDPKER
jgi:uncharacterized protein (TIGR02300 family)